MEVHGLSKALDALNKMYEDFESSWRGDDNRHRMDFAEIIWRGLKREKMTQAALARKARIADADLSQLIHGTKNFTSETFGKVIHALGRRVRVQEEEYVPEEGAQRFFSVLLKSGEIVELGAEDSTSGKEENKVEFKATASTTGHVANG
jgi:transcriptional regulator with XRE-family HTH domain